MKRYLALALLAVCALGCTDAYWGSVTSLAHEARIEMYSGGQLVRTWYSTGKVIQEGEGSDGHSFTEKGTGDFVRVTGDVVITVK